MSAKVLQFLQRFEGEFDLTWTHAFAIIRKWRWRIFTLSLIATVGVEVRTAAVQSWLFTHVNSWLVYEVVSGPSSRVAFPRGGPLDGRRGYNRIPKFIQRLEKANYRITEQVRASRALSWLISLGIAPPVRESTTAGLKIRSADGKPLYDFGERDRGRHFETFEAVPPLLVNTLLFIENRELEGQHQANGHPAIEWSRLAKALLSYSGGKLGLPTPPEGGSTLAVQLEKFRHSPAGRTGSPTEKLRQLVAASLKAYRDGPDTTEERRAIVLDYLNTLPLAAAPGYGEVYGLGEALQAWFGLELEDVRQALTSAADQGSQVHAYKHTLALLLATRAPTALLVKNHAALERKTDQYTRLLAKAGVISNALAEALVKQPLVFADTASPQPVPLYSRDKGTAIARDRLAKQLGVGNLYDLDRLDLEVETTLDAKMQTKVANLLRALGDVKFTHAQGLDQRQMLENSDPRKVIYTFLLLERGAQANLIRVQADNANRPLDFNQGIKLELGSTAKLRTLIHYLEVVAQLHHELSSLNPVSLAAHATSAGDPITQWAAKSLLENPGQSLNQMLAAVMDRRYSASPYESFFTGGGVHSFNNFDPADNSRITPLREGFQRSVNLVFIRLMRDLVRYHRAHLGYDADAILSDVHHPLRKQMLDEIVVKEEQATLRRAYKSFYGLSQKDLIARLLPQRDASPRHLAILYFAWQRGNDEDGLAAWLRQFIKGLTPEDIHKLFKAYSNPRLNLADYAYLLARHPLDLWSAAQFFDRPNLTWDELWNRSAEARRASSAWLFKTRNRGAQDLRLRIRIEADAFARMTPAWQRLGFPFAHLVPSLATAIGNSSDKPIALAELMGIIVHDGLRRATIDINSLRFAAGTAYETVLAPNSWRDERVIDPAVARTVREVLKEVVDLGTAKRIAGAFLAADDTPLRVGGKTGSGDNRFETFNRYGGVTSSRATSRTAAFVFYLGERYFGVITASVSGPEAAHYHFTSALPVSVLKLLAPAINTRLQSEPRVNAYRANPPNASLIPKNKPYSR
ncbi:MAG: hypothetical protein FJ145_20095 [Deltaproteobacteria bacterium]|nr:hypothetical protein [Deltaproteobacteria bacterium]